MRASPVTFSVSTGLRLCGIADEPFWPAAKNSSRLQHFGALQMADLGGEPFERTRDHAQRREIRGMAVARDHLRRHRLDLQTQLFGDMLLDARIDIGERADRAGDRAGRDLLARRDEPRAGARELGIEAGELHAEGRRLGMDAVAAPDGGRHLVFEGALLERRQQRIDIGDQDVGGALELHRRDRCPARPTTSCPDARSAPRGRRIRPDGSGTR